MLDQLTPILLNGTTTKKQLRGGLSCCKVPPDMTKLAKQTVFNENITTGCAILAITVNVQSGLPITSSHRAFWNRNAIQPDEPGMIFYKLAVVHGSVDWRHSWWNISGWLVRWSAEQLVYAPYSSVAITTVEVNAM